MLSKVERRFVAGQNRADRQTDTTTHTQTCMQANGKTLSLELTAFLWSKSLPTAFFLFGVFDIGKSQNMARCPTTAELYITCLLEIESTISVNSNLTYMYILVGSY